MKLEPNGGSNVVANLHVKLTQADVDSLQILVEAEAKRFFEPSPDRLKSRVIRRLIHEAAARLRDQQGASTG